MTITNVTGEEYITIEEYIDDLDHYTNIMAKLLNYIDTTNIDPDKWADFVELLDDDIDAFEKEIKNIPLWKKEGKLKYNL